MAIPSEQDVRKVLTPARHAKIWSAFHAAWDDVAADIAKYSRWPRSRANMMFERLAVRLQEEFASESTKIRFCFADETVKVVVDDLVLLRCKKADNRGLGHNIETQQDSLFLYSEADLFGFAGYQKIEIVYAVNALGTGIRSIMVQARNGDEKVWCFPIERPVSERDTPPIVPLAPTSPISPSLDASDLVQPRVHPGRKEETDDPDKK
jgi:hypothetical protein